ncbi:GMC oxidoreductase [Paractinoplanes brasiliensis]|uniref:GMC oxidoreductase n=1 Tax=Paractinoplanes brasiliensis TaxID=52695 RepID=A0A4R6JQV6_9ACTN|nr:GMC oxidoreductase [Actinoplanes brasiliensis]GID32284.1 hypothetical protein Abr02nite_72670 [Actinoplanes brasiliensis]
MIAARLSEDSRVRVLLLESGPADTLPQIAVPSAWPALRGSGVDYSYVTVPQVRTGNAVHAWPRGHTLGGSSSIDAMMFRRGHAADYDGWAEQGADGWDYASVLPYFRRMETVNDGDPALRGDDGPMRPAPAADPSPLARAFVDAATAGGHRFTFIEAPLHRPALHAPANSFTLGIATVPESRGTLRLVSTDPGVPPLIDPNYLAEGQDVRRLVEAIEVARNIAATEPLARWRDREVLPGHNVRQPGGLRHYLQWGTGASHHPVGTCAMGRGAQAVVDPELRVLGADGLRVADASVMPRIVSAGTNAATIMIGEKASDMIRSTHSLSPQ